MPKMPTIRRKRLGKGIGEKDWGKGLGKKLFFSWFFPRSLSQIPFPDLGLKSLSQIFFLIVGIVGISLLLGCAASQDILIEQYSEFGIKAAQAGLWNESILRWKRVLELDPNNAAAHNNLGVAYEAQGKYEETIAEYNKAIELDPNNKNYKKNYLKCQRNYAKLENNTQNNKENNKENNKVSPDEDEK